MVIISQWVSCGLRGGEVSHQPQRERSLSASGRGVSKQRARTLNLLLYQHCICNQLRFAEPSNTWDSSIKQYMSHGPTCQRLGLFIVGRGTTAVCCQVWQDTSTRKRRARFVIWRCCSFPCRCTSQGPPPNHSCAAWCLLCRSIHVLSVSATPECCVKFQISSTRYSIEVCTDRAGPENEAGSRSAGCLSLKHLLFCLALATLGGERSH